ncbi:PrsW family glutamic-type intramembrane protease [Anabaena cylindrica UHCC 0172]|uniref:PrsW family intramembrane metalloprotease n=1 Tax=Anabaena cylindrica TaxID=1165 RepID=UPI002B1F199E|nr:PrsW family glutamic-type intramembrane protease [Anabaena cylindrica]MEA5550239.1 PrsW family glutamic-type intramembrane protease [Anabaena cylindrica UHCC 0172]
MANLSLLLWAVIPPLLFLWFYYRRTPAAPPLPQLLFLFIFGIISGFVALGLEWTVETVANSVVDWAKIQRSFFGFSLRQLLEIAPIEEGCKLAAVIFPISYLQRRYRFRATTVFIFTIAVALGFGAEENWIYWVHGTAPMAERMISTPVHPLFSAPWGYALGIYISSTRRLNRDRSLIFIAWLNAVFFHALVNILSRAWVYPRPIHFLGYVLFPLLLWMFWRLEQLLRKVQRQRPITLISGYIPQARYWQRVLIMLILLLGGNAIFGLFLLVRKLSPLRLDQLFETDILSFILKQIVLNLFLGVLSWLIYRYLRYLANRRYFLKLGKY